MSTGVKSINVLTELDHLGIKWTAIGDDEVRVPCPCHDDTSPSASLNVRDHVFKCFVPSCNASGDFVSFVAYSLKVPRQVALADLQKRYPYIEGVAEIPSQTVEKFHARIKEAGPLLVELKNRGVSDEMIREARLGFHDGRITIPIYDDSGRCRNVRRYLPGAPGPQKMRNTTGHGAAMLYRSSTIEGAKTVMICGGEMKALVAGTLLAGKGIACVCTTGGEGHWNDSWTDRLKGKDVVICMDIDDAGVAASRRLAMATVAKARTVKIVTLPLDRVRFPKGDVNDWVGACGATAEDFVSIISKTPAWSAPTRAVAVTSETRKLALEKAIASSNVGERVEVEAVIAASDTTPFLVPREVDVECTRSEKYCHICPIRLEKVDMSGWSRVKIDAGSSSILGMMGASDKEQSDRIKDAVGIPSCGVVRFHARSHHVVHDVRLSPPIDISGSGKSGDAWYPAVIVSESAPDLSVPCRMRGSVHPHPRSQQAVALISEFSELEDSLSTFRCSEAELNDMRVFQPSQGMTVASKIAELATDLAANVTWIYDRPDLHIAMDFAFHSVLMLNYGGRQINGWTNILVVGDSAQGKSECAARLMTHYGVGDKTDCKNVTVAGLLGGLEQLGNRWFIRWGVIPRADRMLVVLEELKGASTEVLSKLTEMRSSGVAEIPKIERRKALARTRLIAISNPRTPRPMAAFHFGIQAVQELIGSLEDVRRFDMAIALGRGEVSESVINVTHEKRRKIPHVATSSRSRRLILWAWTRKPSDVIIDSSADDAIMSVSNMLSEKYDEAIPLVDRGTIRQKVARLSAAAAARTFSSKDGVKLIVTAEHARFVGSYLDGVYSSKVMGYDSFSEAHRMMSNIQDPEEVERLLRNTKHPSDLAAVLMRRDTISMEDLQSAAEVDYDGARSLMSMLVRKGAIIRTSRTDYAKSSGFIDILKRLRSMDKKNEHDLTRERF